MKRAQNAAPGQQELGNQADEVAAEEETFWHKAIHQHNFYRPEIGFDRYRWALRFGRLARKRHKGDVSFSAVAAELEKAWKDHGGPSGLSWEEARDAVHAAWERSGTLQAEAIASHAGFKEPPTFSDNGGIVPRNVDEPNS
jgi:hypothetical protein